VIFNSINLYFDSIQNRINSINLYLSLRFPAKYLIKKKHYNNVNIYLLMHKNLELILLDTTYNKVRAM